MPSKKALPQSEIDTKHTDCKGFSDDLWTAVSELGIKDTSRNSFTENKPNELLQNHQSLHEVSSAKDTKSIQSSGKLAIILAVGKDRKGNEADVERFLQLLPKLGYDNIINIPDPTSQDMKRTLQKVALEVDTTYDGLLVIIACHGHLGGVLEGSDGANVKLHDLQRLVNGIRAPSLLNKPKIFLVSACRGQEELKGVRVECDGSKDQEVKFTNVGTDFYTALSTIEGHKSWRDTEKGTYFLQEVAAIWEKHYKEESMHSVMRRVRNQVLQKHEGNQVVECVDTLTKELVNGKYAET